MSIRITPESATHAPPKRKKKDGEQERDQRARRAKRGLDRSDHGEECAEKLREEDGGVSEKEPTGDLDGVRRAGGRRTGDGGPQHELDQGADDLLRLPWRDAPSNAEDDHPAPGDLQPRLRRCQPGYPLPGQAGGHRCRLLSGDHAARLGDRSDPCLHHQTRRGRRSPEHQQPGAGERQQQQRDRGFVFRFGQVGYCTHTTETHGIRESVAYLNTSGIGQLVW